MSDRIVRPIVTVGYDKNGEFDWSMSIAPLKDMTVEQMIVLRSHLLLACHEVDNLWRQFGPPSRDFASKQTDVPNAP